MIVSRLSDYLNELNREDLTLREISERAQEHGKRISHSTAGNYMKGIHPEHPPRRALEALAAVFGVTADELEQLALPEGAVPYVPRSGSEKLTHPQRAAVDEIIRLLIETNHAHDDHTPDPRR